MITQVSGVNVSGIQKDPRRKAQSYQFKNQANIPYYGRDKDPYSKQKNNALLTSLSIVAGSFLFTVGYFLISAFSLKNVSKRI